MKVAMHIQKISLILILTLLLTGACHPFTPAQPANSRTVASIDGVTQPLPATPTPVTSPSQAEVSSPSVPSSGTPTEGEAVQPADSDSEINPERSFPLAPDTRWDPGNGGGEEEESSGAFSLHSNATMETVNQFYQSALASQGWKLRYIDANHAGGVTQYWKQGMLYMSVDFGYDNSGLAIQSQWRQIDLQAVQMLPQDVPLPDQAEFVDATETTWEVYIPQEIEAVAGYYQQKAAALNWKPGSVPSETEGICGSDCASSSTPGYPPGVTPMPTATPDPRKPQTLAYTKTDGNEISLEFYPHRDATILTITLTLKNVESAGLPKELPIYPGATGMVIAPGMVRFTAPLDLKAMIQFYAQIMTDAGWKPSPGYSLDTPQLYFQEWDKGEDSLRFNISSPESAPQSSLVSIQCVQCTAP
jgi:hypothetical protein